MKTCKTCLWWDQYRPDGGKCLSDSVSRHWDERDWIRPDEAMIDTSPGSPSQTAFITGPDFSCGQWSEGTHPHQKENER